MKITAVMTVRNEQHVLATNIAHHRALGVDEFRILDNGSQDGTVEVITAMAERDPSVKWTTDDGPYRQNEMVTELAREAFRHGADWVVPIDADEFLVDPEPVAESRARSFGCGGTRLPGGQLRPVGRSAPRPLDEPGHDDLSGTSLGAA